MIYKFKNKLKNLKTKKLKNIVTVFLAIILLSTLSIIIKNNHVKNVRAFSDLVVDYGQVVPGEPIFDSDDFKPGDCTTKSMVVTNNSTASVMTSIKSENEIDDSNLSTVFPIIISENSIDLYGGASPGGSKYLSDFFSESVNPNGIPLSIIPGNGGQTTYDIEVCFNIDAGNEFQLTNVKFDLLFGVIISDNLVINEVYYQGEEKGCGCFCCCGDFNIEGCGETPCSKNIFEYSVGNGCFSFQKNDNGRTGNPCSGFVSESKSMGFSCKSVNLFNKYNFNHFSCGDWGRVKSMEWIEIFNPTERTIRLRNWYLQDNSGELVKISTWKRLRPGQFALITKSPSTWRSWEEGEDAIKIYLRRKIGDGLDDNGDHLHLISPSEVIVDSVGWGDDTAVWDPAVPGVSEGSSIERLTQGFDTNSASDWEERFLPTPGF